MEILVEGKDKKRRWLEVDYDSPIIIGDIIEIQTYSYPIVIKERMVRLFHLREKEEFEGDGEIYKSNGSFIGWEGQNGNITDYHVEPYFDTAEEIASYSKTRLGKPVKAKVLRIKGESHYGYTQEGPGPLF